MGYWDDHVSGSGEWEGEWQQQTAQVMAIGFGHSSGKGLDIKREMTT
jgi:hypothetical protein